MKMRHRNAHHFTFSPKYRRAVLGNDQIKADCERLMRHICHIKNMDILAINIQSDHIHIFLDIPRTMSPAKAAQLIKWFSSIWLRKSYKLVSEKNFWQKRYYSRSIGGDSRQIKKYIESQTHGAK